MTLAARRRRDAAAFRGTPEPEPLTVIDATTISDPQNADEALAVFSLYAEPGDTLTLCSDWCRSNLGEPCSCSPTRLVVGAEA